MNSKSAEMDVADLRRLFSICDANKSGRIEYEDLTVVCKELSVSNAEISALFKKFDVDGDGYIDFSDFSARYKEVSDILDIASLEQPLEPSRNAWEEFEERLDGGTAFLGRSQEPVMELYQQICMLDPSLLQRYEVLLRVLVSESREHSLENQQLQSNLRRMKEMTVQQLAEMEEDLQQQVALVEQRVRDEEHLKLETTITAMQKKHESELVDLQTAVEKLKKLQEKSQHSSPRVDVQHLKSQIHEITMENESLRSSLNNAQTTISVLQVELDRLKDEYSEQRLQHERETDHLKAMLMECQSYSTHIAVLQEMNKKLYDSNDGLRSALAQNILLNNRKSSPRRSSRRMKPIRQSTLKHTRSVDEGITTDPNKVKYSHVATWADKYLDSGVSITTETVASSYDSDDSRESMETVHRSYSCVPSDAEVSEVKSELGISAAVSRCGSIASSIRRRLSAFPSKHADRDIPDTDVTGPTYKLVLAGDAGSGKSSFLLRLCKNEFRGDIQTTLGVDFQMKKMLVDGEKTNLQIWDTAGQERFRSIARSYFRKAHGILLLYDVTSESSFLHIREWVDQIQEATDELLPMCIVGNKADLRTAQSEGGSVGTIHGEKLAMAYSALFCETSAKEGTNVVEAVLHLAREVKKNQLRRKSEPKVKLSIADGKKAFSNCCGV